MSLARSGQTLRFLAFFVDAATGQGKSGLSDVTVDVLQFSSNTRIRDGVAATEAVGPGLGRGWYFYDLPPSYNNTFRDDFGATFKTASSEVERKELPGSYTVDNGFLAAINRGSPTFQTSAQGDEIELVLGASLVESIDIGVDLSGDEVLVFIATKSFDNDDADDAILRVHSVNGLERIGGANPLSSSNGVLSAVDSTFTLMLASAESGPTTIMRRSRIPAHLYGTDTDGTPDTRRLRWRGHLLLTPGGKES